MTETQQIDLNKIEFNSDFQAREQMSADTVNDYISAMKDGAKFPPVVVYQDAEKYYLADGYHRVAAALKLEQNTITAKVHVGNRRDAMLYAVGANANHGLRRTRADKRRAVEMMLRDDEWRHWSDRQIARKAHVDHKTVGSIRKELEAAGEIPQITKRTGGDGKVVDTSNIGSSPAPAQEIKQWSEMNNGVRRLNKDWIEANFDTGADWHVLHKRIGEQVNPDGFTFIQTNHGFLYIGKEKTIRSAVETCGLMDSGEWYYTQNHHGSCWLVESVLLFEKVSSKLYKTIYYPALQYPTHTFANQHVRFDSKKKSALRALPAAKAQVPIRFQNYDLVETRVGKLGLVLGVDGRLIKVWERSRISNHYAHDLKLIERPETLTAETLDGYFERIGFKQDREKLFTDLGLAHLIADPLIATFAVGDRVNGFHISKGDGTVVAVEGNWLLVDFGDDDPDPWKVRPAFVTKIKAEEPSDTLHDETEPDRVPARESLEQPVQLPVRQIEFLQALAAGEPVVKNAATRYALRGHGYITETDDWSAIELSAAGIEALAWHNADVDEQPEQVTFNPETNQLRPPVRYYGGKWRIAPWIIEKFPEHITYFEPFCGGASILFRKHPSKYEAINDLNNDVVTFFEVLRTREDELIRAIELTPHSREEHRRAHERADDPLEQARRFYVRSRQSYGSGEGKHNTGWRYQVRDKRGTAVVDEWNTTDHLRWAANRLKQVQIECDDAFKAIERWDAPTTLMYVDPPYMFETRYSEERRYHTEMTDDNHAQLLDLLCSVKAMVLLSSYENPLYEETLTAAGWSPLTKDTRTNDNHDATEVLWMNPAALAANTPMFSYSMES